MAFQRIGILSIGEMGYHWAKLLRSHGVEVLTYARDRSGVTRKRAENVGVRSVATMVRLVNEADLIVSVVVPSAAKRVASKVVKAVSKAGRDGLLYVDVNAISPMTADSIGAVLTRSQVKFVDGCIIGSATKMDRGAVVYVSGPDASRVRELESFGFSVRVLGPDNSQASAFKVVYAGLTKGLQGLFVELLMGARKFGLLDEIIERYNESFPDLLNRLSHSIAGLRIHAGRRAEEMDELKRTFAHHDMTAIMAPATQKVLSRIAALECGTASETGARQGDLREALELFFQKGLLQKKASGAPEPGVPAAT